MGQDLYDDVHFLAAVVKIVDAAEKPGGDGEAAIPPFEESHFWEGLRPRGPFGIVKN